MTLKEFLIKWNKGVEKGIQTKFAKVLNVAQVSVSGWIKGNIPDELLRPRIAKELGITVEELMTCFPRRPATGVAESPAVYTTINYIPVPRVVSAENFLLKF